MPAYYENFAFFTRRFNLFKWPGLLIPKDIETRDVSFLCTCIYLCDILLRKTNIFRYQFFYTSWCLRRQIFLSIEKTRGQDSAGRYINFVITSLEDWLLGLFVSWLYSPHRWHWLQSVVQVLGRTRGVTLPRRYPILDESTRQDDPGRQQK